MNFLDLFAGIGGFRMGMEMAGHTCIGYCEIDKFARNSYESIFDTKGEWTAHDIRSVSDESIRGIGHTDILCGGFPCQAFSISGKREGFRDVRGTLFFEIIRFAHILKPKYLFLENVEGLLTHEEGITFETIISTLDELGYNVEWQVCNSQDFQLPQNRPRIFFIGHLRGQPTYPIFPIEGTTKQATGHKRKTEIVQFADFRYDEGLRIRERSISPCLAASKNAINNDLSNCVYVIKNRKGIYLTRNEIEKEDVLIAPCLLARDYKGLANNQVTAGVMYECEEDKILIRRLTPKEFWRLQGMPDWAFEKAQKVNSPTQLLKQAGNSVSVNVIYEIAKRFKK